MYFKILKNDMTHHGFTYHEGLNTDTKPFDKIPECGGGLFFSDEKNILQFCEYGDKIAVVTVPEGELIIPVDNKYKAHSIILSDIKDLYTAETIDWLVSLGVDIHADNDIILIEACRNGYLEVTKRLIDQSVCSSDIKHALWTATYNEQFEIVKYLVERGAYSDSILGCAAERGYFNIVKYLVKHGIDIHALDDCALRCAVAQGHLEIVKYLVEHGADIHANDDWVLKWAIGYGHLDVAKYLAEQMSMSASTIKNVSERNS